MLIAISWVAAHLYPLHGYSHTPFPHQLRRPLRGGNDGGRHRFGQAVAVANGVHPEAGGQGPLQWCAQRGRRTVHKLY